MFPVCNTLYSVLACSTVHMKIKICFILAGGGSVAVAVSVGDRGSVTVDR